MKEYKAIPAPKAIVITGQSTVKTAAQTFEDIINREAKGGWRFCSAETLTVSENGCLSNNQSTSHYMLIFERER